MFKEEMFCMEHKREVGFFFQKGVETDWKDGEERSIFQEAE